MIITHMPKKPKDYSKALIYKICCKDPTIKDIYVGSTTNFVKRKASHKERCNNTNARDKKYNFKVYQFIREHGGFDNWELVLIEYYPCTTEPELGRREDHFKNELQASLNVGTPPIYETYKECNRAQFHRNKEHILKKRSEEKITCECGCTLTKHHYNRHLKTKKHLKYLEKK